MAGRRCRERCQTTVETLRGGLSGWNSRQKRDSDSVSILGVTDASCLIRRFTRFTDEIFAALISIIFLVEAVRGISGYIEEARAGDLVHDVAFLSLIMAIGTFAIAMLLSKLRGSRYLVPTAREFLSDFSPTLAFSRGSVCG